MTKSSLSILYLLHNVKSTVKISSNFVAFLKNINFKKQDRIVNRIKITLNESCKEENLNMYAIRFHEI